MAPMRLLVIYPGAEDTLALEADRIMNDAAETRFTKVEAAKANARR
jgi:hypothetical protein